ncbi:hypothetical protein H4R35_003867 [Dimargaris xerosporica]|nr:hypothetical protein H4R35_003867 [Dimargaris xerosporica]
MAASSALPADALHTRPKSALSLHAHAQPTRYIAKAVYSFQGEKEDDLQFSRGDMIAIRECTDPNWWVGTLINKDKAGRFPACLVRIAGQYDQDTSPQAVRPAALPNVSGHPPSSLGSSVASTKTLDAGLSRGPSLSELNLEEILLNLANVEAEVDGYAHKSRDSARTNAARVGAHQRSADEPRSMPCQPSESTPRPSHDSFRPSPNAPLPKLSAWDAPSMFTDPLKAKATSERAPFDPDISGTTQCSDDPSSTDLSDDPPAAPSPSLSHKARSSVQPPYERHTPTPTPTGSTFKPLPPIPKRFAAPRTPTPTPRLLDTMRKPANAAGNRLQPSQLRVTTHVSLTDVTGPASLSQPKKTASPTTLGPAVPTAIDLPPPEPSPAQPKSPALAVEPARSDSQSYHPLGGGSLARAKQPSPLPNASCVFGKDDSMFSQEFHRFVQLNRDTDSPFRYAPSPIPNAEPFDNMSMFSQDLDYRPSTSCRPGRKSVDADDLPRAVATSTPQPSPPASSGTRNASSLPSATKQPSQSSGLRVRNPDPSDDQEPSTAPISAETPVPAQPTIPNPASPAAPPEPSPTATRPAASPSPLDRSQDSPPTPANNGRESRLKPLPPLPPTRSVSKSTAASLEASEMPSDHSLGLGNSSSGVHERSHGTLSSMHASGAGGVQMASNVFDISRMSASPEPTMDIPLDRYIPAPVPPSSSSIRPPPPFARSLRRQSTPDPSTLPVSAPLRSGSALGGDRSSWGPVSAPPIPTQERSDVSEGSYPALGVAPHRPASAVGLPANYYSAFHNIGPDGQPLPSADSGLPPEFMAAGKGAVHQPPTHAQHRDLSPFPANGSYMRTQSPLPGYSTPVGFYRQFTPVRQVGEPGSMQPGDGHPMNASYMPSSGLGPVGAMPTSTAVTCFQVLAQTRPVVDLGAHALNVEKYHFAKVDKYARNVRYNSSSLSPATLSHKYLTRPFQTNLEKLRAIFTWIVANIVWDRTTSGGLGYNESIPSHEAETAQVVLQRRTCRHEGFANLFQAMAEAIGVDAPLVTGYVKSPLDTYHGSYYPEPNQSWNVLRLETGEYRFIDCGSASLAFFKSNVDFEGTDRSQVRIDDFYFLTKPEHLIYTHYPANLGQQFLEPPLSLPMFWQLPYVRGGYFKHQVRIQNFAGAQAEIHNDDLFMLILKLAPNTLAYAEVEIPDQHGRVVSRFPGFTQCLNHKNRRLCKVMVRFRGGADVQGVLKVYVGHYKDALCTNHANEVNGSGGDPIGKLDASLPTSVPARPLSRVSQATSVMKLPLRRNLLKKASSQALGHHGPSPLSSGGSRRPMTPGALEPTSPAFSALGTGSSSVSHSGFMGTTSAATANTLLTRHTFPLAFTMHLRHTGSDSAHAFARLHLTPQEFYLKQPTHHEFKYGQTIDFHVLAFNSSRRHLKLQLLSPANHRLKFTYQPLDQSYILKTSIKEYGEWHIIYLDEDANWRPIVSYLCVSPANPSG